MELQTGSDVEGVVTCKKLERRAQVEKRIRQLGYVPNVAFIAVVLYAMLTQMFSIDVDITSAIIVLSGVVVSVGRANAMRMDLIRESITLDTAK